MFDHFRKGRKWFLVIVAGAVGTFTAAQAGYAQGGTWTPLAPVSPSAAEGMTVGGIGQVIVGAYGFSGGYTNQTRLYNINTDTWSTGLAAPMPARAGAASGDTTHGGFLYVIGGESSTGVLADLQRYDPVLDAWITLTPMPTATARAGAAAAVIDDSIFVIGGRQSTGGPCSGGPYLTTVEKYDIDTDTWSPVAPLLNGRSDLAAVVHGGKIFVFGGCTGPASAPIVTDEVDMYDPQTNTWTSTGLMRMTIARASLAAGHSGDNVYAIGGTDGVLASNANEVYDVAHNTWSNNTLMTAGRQEAGVNSHGGRIYVVGGSTTFGTSSNVNDEVFKP